MRASAVRPSHLGWRLARVSCLCLLVAGVGCGKKGPKLYPVEGKVTSGGTPVTTGVVTLHPQNKEMKERPIANISPEGTYKVTTNGKEGAPLGRYTVTVSTMVPPGADVPPPSGKPVQKDKGSRPTGATVPVNPRYLSPDSSKLTIEVVENPQSGAYDLKLVR